VVPDDVPPRGHQLAKLLVQLGDDRRLLFDVRVLGVVQPVASVPFEDQLVH
jgi:hypothetical protein